MKGHSLDLNDDTHKYLHAYNQPVRKTLVRRGIGNIKGGIRYELMDDTKTMVSSKNVTSVDT